MTPPAIVVVTWNALEHTRACLESMFATGASPAQVIDVDNGSSDGTPEAVAALGVRLLRNAENQGFARAANRGMREAGERDVLLVNSDVVFREPGWLERLGHAASERPRAGAAGARLVYPDGQLQEAGVRIAWDPLCIRRIGHGEPDLGQYGATREVAAVSFAATLLRREALAAVGLLDEAYVSYFEDIDLCLRLTAAGWSVLCAGEVTVEHVEAATSKANRVDQAATSARAQRIFERKWNPPPRAARGELLVLPWLEPDAESTAVAESVLLGLEDLGFRTSMRLRTAFGSRLEPGPAGHDWDALFRAMQYRTPGEPPRLLVLGTPFGDALEAASESAALIAFAGAEAPLRPSDLVSRARFSPGSAVAEALRARELAPEVATEIFHRGLHQGRHEEPGPRLLVLGGDARRAGLASAVAAFTGAFSGGRDGARLTFVACGVEPPHGHLPKGVETHWLPSPRAVDRAHFYREADALVLPGGAESWGLFRREAFACGLPVISVRAPLPGEYSDRDVELVVRPAAAERIPAPFAPRGILRRAADSGDLARAFCELAADPAAATRRAERARETLAEEGAPGAALDRLTSAIAELGPADPERWPAGANPVDGPLASSAGRRRHLELAAAASNDPHDGTLVELASARLAANLTRTMQEAATKDGLAARIALLESELVAASAALPEPRSLLRRLARHLARRL